MKRIAVFYQSCRILAISFGTSALHFSPQSRSATWCLRKSANSFCSSRYCRSRIVIKETPSALPVHPPVRNSFRITAPEYFPSCIYICFFSLHLPHLFFSAVFQQSTEFRSLLILSRFQGWHHIFQRNYNYTLCFLHLQTYLQILCTQVHRTELHSLSSERTWQWCTLPGLMFFSEPSSAIWAIRLEPEPFAQHTKNFKFWFVICESPLLFS